MLERLSLRSGDEHDGSRKFGQVLLGVSLLFFVYRFVNFDLCVFLLDEPTLLAESRHALQFGQFVTHSPLVGTQSIQYGPTTMWLFAAIHRWLGSDVQTFTLAIGILGTLSNAVLAIRVGRFFGDRYVIPATLVAFVASSPYLFFWARIPWDPIVNICTGFVVSLLCRRTELRILPVLAIGGLLGFGLSTHPAMFPLSMVATLLVALRSGAGKRLRNLATSIATTLVINLPYLYYVAEYHLTMSASHPGRVRSLSTDVMSRFLTEPLRVLTTARIDYFFDTAWQSFTEDSVFSARLSKLSTAAVPAFPWLIALGLVIALLVQPRFSHRVLALAAIVVWIGYAAFYSWLGLAPHPHYQFSIWWVALVALASLLQLSRRYLGFYVVAIVSCWGLSICQSGFLVSWMHYIREHQGTRGIYYGVPQGYQKTVVRKLCEHGGSRIYVDNRTDVFSHSLHYISTVEPECENKFIQIQNGHSRQIAESEEWALSYEKPGSAALVVTKIR